MDIFQLGATLYLMRIMVGPGRENARSYLEDMDFTNEYWRRAELEDGAAGPAALIKQMMAEEARLRGRAAELLGHSFLVAHPGVAALAQ